MNFATLSRFKALCQRHGIPENLSVSVFQYLVNKYSEPDRSYHNLENIDRMLSLLVKADRADDEIEFAVWFHDIVYNPGDIHYARKSADCFLSKFDGYLWSEFAGEVERLILATDPTVRKLGTNRESFILDLNLSIFSASPEQYLSYSNSLHALNPDLTDEEFRNQRILTLRSMLNDKIYITRYFEAFETQAKENIKTEIERLLNLVD